MPKTVTSRQFNQDTGGAKRAAKTGPVIITDRGEPAYVLLSIDEFRRLSGKGMSLFEAIADHRPEADFEFDPPRMQNFTFKAADFD